MKKFMMLHYGFEKPTDEVMKAWGEWFALVADKLVDRGGHFSQGKEVSHTGTENLPLSADSITGYNVIEAENLEEAESIAQKNPFIKSIRVYEITS